MFWKIKSIIVILIISFFLVGCHTDDSNAPSSDLNGLATVLSFSFVSRDPTNSRPTLFQQQILNQNDQLLFSGITPYLAYDSFIQNLRGVVGIDPNAGIFVTSDIRTSFSFGGGVAGHDLLYLDGKFLDILRATKYQPPRS